LYSRAQEQGQTAGAGGKRQEQEQTIFHFSFVSSHLAFRTEEVHQWKMTDDK
jgi:hypothetical protein